MAKELNKALVRIEAGDFEVVSFEDDGECTSPTTQEQVEREVIERLVKKALSDASDLCRERYLGDERAKALRYLANWLRSQIGER